MAQNAEGTRAKTNPARARLAVGIITRNSVDLLPGTLRCALEIADQIVVVDSNSTDGTATIARKYAHTVLSIPWTDDFSKPRNAALEAMSADWALWLDAGETLNDEDAKAIRAFVDNEAEASCLYYLNVRIPPPFHGASSEQVARMRLCPIRPGLRFTGRISERVDEQSLQPEELPWVIQRGSREHLHEVRLARAERNLRIAQKELSEVGPSARLLNVIGEAHLTMSAKPQASAAFEESLRIASPESLDMLEAFYGRITTCDDDSAGRDMKISICLDALEVFPLDAQLLCTLGTFMQAANRLELAARSFRAAVEHGQVRPAAWHLSNLGEVASFCLANCLQGLGQEDSALAVLREAVASFPSSERLRRRLIDLLIVHGGRDEALQMVDGLSQTGESREVLRSVIRGAFLCVDKRWISALAYLQTAYLAGSRDPLCCKWLAIALASSGSYSAALGVLRDWKVCEPSSRECEQMLVEVQTKLAENPTTSDAETSRRQQTADHGPQKIVRVHEQGSTPPKPRTATAPTTETAQSSRSL